ncbi:MAG TPA: acyl-CoA dehydrogenase family protein [Candidatus Dormibacteraeota bacterium]|nr:acyl-CoA dehydrogenase family protein [Candidatus Dormibacteraeota bacterium]
MGLDSIKAVVATDRHQDLRSAVRQLCAHYSGEYWRELDARQAYPEEFVGALTKAGWLGALIPVEYGGGGLGIREASVILEEVNRSGGNAAVCHAQMYVMGTLLRHGSEVQKRRYLPQIAAGKLRLQAFGITEPNSGSETTRIETTALRVGDAYRINGEKVFISRAEHSDLLLLLARTTPYDRLANKSEGLSIFIVPLREAVADGQIEIRPLKVMFNHHTTQLFIRDLVVPAENLVGDEGGGFRYLLDGLNAERILIAAESIGDGRWFIERAVGYAKSRVVFDRPIGANQGVQFPIALAHAHVEAADLMRWKAAELFDADQPCGAEANMAKLLAADAAWEAANACVDTFGGYGFASEYDVERKFRETRLYKVAPINNNLVLAYVAQHVLGMPRSY